MKKTNQIIATFSLLALSSFQCPAEEVAQKEKNDSSEIKIVSIPFRPESEGEPEPESPVAVKFLKETELWEIVHSQVLVHLNGEVSPTSAFSRRVVIPDPEYLLILAESDTGRHPFTLLLVSDKKDRAERRPISGYVDGTGQVFLKVEGESEFLPASQHSLIEKAKEKKLAKAS